MITMSERRGPRRPDEPVPRDPEEPRATAGEPLSVPVPEDVGGGKAADPEEPGTGPGAHPRKDTVNPEPDEPTD